MSLHIFTNSIRQQIKKIVNYSNHNIYQIDDILDMMNKQMSIPGEIAEHQILIPIGRFICYFVIDHPHKGRCHYFQIKPDASGRLADKKTIEDILKEFGIESPLLDEYITVDKVMNETNVVIPFES